LVTSDQNIEIDPLLNVSAANPAVVNLGKGKYVATLRNFGVQINGRHFADIALGYTEDGEKRQVRFLNKGKFDSLLPAKSAYEGLTLVFNHDGGEVGGFFHMIPTANVAGSVTVDFARVEEVQESIEVAVAPEIEEEFVAAVESIEPVDEPEHLCSMDSTHLAWYERSWSTGNCCGAVVEVSGQKYIVVKKSLAGDTSCGGGEQITTPCIAVLKDIGHPAFAWPTLDGVHFAPIPPGEILFKYNKELNDLVVGAIKNRQYDDPKGSPSGHRHLSHQLDIILFPVG
jgi:hypothetical protein